MCSFVCLIFSRHIQKICIYIFQYASSYLSFLPHPIQGFHDVCAIFQQVLGEPQAMLCIDTETSHICQYASSYISFLSLQIQKIRTYICQYASSYTSFSPHPLQGFHDVCAIFQQVLSEPQAMLCIERVSRNHLRDYLRPSMAEAVRNLDILYPLLALVDPEVHARIERYVCECLPYMCLYISIYLERSNDVYCGL